MFFFQLSNIGVHDKLPLYPNDTNLPHLEAEVSDNKSSLTIDRGTGSR